MSKSSFVAVAIVVLGFSVGVRAQDAPKLIPPVVPSASAKPRPRLPVPKPQRLTCAVGASFDTRQGRCVKPDVIPVITDQVPEGHREETITVSKSKWEQMGADLTRAAERITQLKKQVAELQQQVDDLKKKPGCGG